MTSERPTRPASLVSAAVAGDHDAFAQIMATHDGDMTRVCMVICGDVNSARHAVQSAWPIAWQRLGSLRDPERLRPWLMSVAANEARQWLRSERRRARREILADPLPPADPADRGERLDLVAAVARLPVEDRRIVALRYIAGLTSAEIAQQLGGSAASVRGRLARILGRLRKELGDD